MVGIGDVTTWDTGCDAECQSKKVMLLVQLLVVLLLLWGVLAVGEQVAELLS